MPTPKDSQNRWSALSLKDRADLIKLFTQNGVTSISKMKEIFNSDIDHALSSDKDFVQRLRDYPNTPVIENEDGSHSTHLMNSGEVNGRGVVWPSIQRQNGQLHDFRNTDDGGLNQAIQQNDTLQMHPATARYYAENYKRYYPNIKDYGGPLVYPFSKKVIPAVRYAEGGDMDNPPYGWTYFSSPFWAPPASQGYDVKIPFAPPPMKGRVSDKEVIENYSKNVIWKMENPNNKGYDKKTGLYYSYTDKDASGNEHTNIGPGLEKNGHPDIDYTRGYSREQIDRIVNADLVAKMGQVSTNLEEMQDGKYAGVRDTLSIGPLMTLLDIAHNVKTSKKRNMPQSWPSLVKALATGNLEEAKKQTYSGSKRRQDMRNDLLIYGPITEETVINR